MCVVILLGVGEAIYFHYAREKDFEFHNDEKNIYIFIYNLKQKFMTSENRNLRGLAESALAEMYETCILITEASLPFMF